MKGKSTPPHFCRLQKWGGVKRAETRTGIGQAYLSTVTEFDREVGGDKIGSAVAITLY